MAQRTRRSVRAVPARRRRRASVQPRETVQYTVRDVPAYVDQALRRKAVESCKSLNEVLRDALIKEAEGGGRVYTDLDAIAGSWVEVPGFAAALRAQDQVDEALWR